MAWDEWERLKAAAAERNGAQMQLNQLPAEQSGGTGDLISNKPAWTKSGTDIGSLREDISKATARLEDGQTGLGSDTGCLTAAAQKDVYDSWHTYVAKVGGRCGKLSGLLVKAGNDQLWAMGGPGDDQVVRQGGRLMGLGDNLTIPTDESFGGNIMKSDSDGHSGFWDESSQSLRNQAAVISGKYHRVELE
ncbi:hypothetical protein [Streptomyces sp. NPDC059701]|uniref:hypothetical protein n=1 Tax=Streptomyces sp. NPDC059701 TaxID=3346914 RepID=UPI0036CB57E6